MSFEDAPDEYTPATSTNALLVVVAFSGMDTKNDWESGEPLVTDPVAPAI